MNSCGEIKEMVKQASNNWLPFVGTMNLSLEWQETIR